MTKKKEVNMKDDSLRHIYDISLFNISDLDVLLHEILKQTRELLHAQAGTIYIKDKDDLKFHVFQNDALSYEDVYKCYHAYKDFKFPLNSNNKYLVVDAFKSKKIILINDIYESKEYKFSGVREFDIKFNYKTHSIITIPLIHPIEGNVLGVVQLLNKKNDEGFVPFSTKDKEILSMFASFISLSIEKAQNNIDKLKTLNKQLTQTNEDLEKRIKKEVSRNESKSAIIFHQSKMASMGEMIGNIAHQWRQPLSTISTIASGVSLGLQLDKLNKNDSINQLNKIVETTQELSKTIDNFSTFYELNTDKETFNISKIINKALEIAETEITSTRIEVIPTIDTSLVAYGIVNEFIQVILNIISNARDALFSNIKVQRYIFINLYKKDERIYLSIKDNALGIPEDIQNEIFEQHFTTKASTGGTGIGLFMSKLIIEEQMNGKLLLNNEDFEYNDENYRGAKFTIILT